MPFFSDCFPGPEFLCENHRCIPFFLQCDGFDHCGDGSDENERCAINERKKNTPRIYNIISNFSKKYQVGNDQYIFSSFQSRSSSRIERILVDAYTKLFLSKNGSLSRFKNGRSGIFGKCYEFNYANSFANCDFIPNESPRSGTTIATKPIEDN